MSKYVKITQEYAKLRKDFGRQPLFQSVPPQMLDSITPDVNEQNQYTLRNPVHRHVQATLPQSVHNANTKQLVTHEQGINHTEGGWPREIHIYNEEHVARHRRRVTHDDSYVHTVMNLAPLMQRYVSQNNAIDMYQTYFADMKIQEPVEKYSIHVANIFRDLFHRAISCVAWTNETNSKLAVCYSHRTLNTTVNETSTCYLWDTSVQNEPAHTLEPSHSCWQIACSPKEPAVLIGGLENGTACIFDVRKGKRPVAFSSVYNSHRGPITSLHFINSRSQTEFFTGSSDGQCLWWDGRNLSQPIDQLCMSIKLSPNEIPNPGNAEGISSLDYNNGLPTRFLCGTESGYVINVNRMGREHSEKITSHWDAHIGPVRAVLRSPCTLRMFITCGDFSVRIWSEEVRTAPIIVTKPYRYQVTDVAWAPLRYSSFMSACAGGIFYYWDLLREYTEPVATLRISKNEITKLSPHVEGQLVAVGDNNGTVFLAALSESMVTAGENDKVLMHQLYDRETRREHILDNRVKEINLKQRLEEKTDKNKVNEDAEEKNTNEEELVRIAKDEYFKIVHQELKNTQSITESSLD